MARRKSKKHLHDAAALAEYGEPWGDVGILDDIMDPQDLKEAGILLGAGLGTIIVAPQAMKLVDMVMPVAYAKYSPYVKGLLSIVGGFSAFKWGRRLHYNSAVGVGATLMGLGVATIGKQLLGPNVDAKGKAELGKTLFPIALGDSLPDELALLSALDAVEDEALAGLGEDEFGGVTSSDEFDGLDAQEDEFGQLSAGDDEFGDVDADVEDYDPALSADVDPNDPTFDADVEERDPATSLIF